MRNTRGFHRSLCLVLLVSFLFYPLLSVESTQGDLQQIYTDKNSQEPQIKNSEKTNDDESFFTFVIVWGTYEEKCGSSFFGIFVGLRVYSPGPWYNRTMYVLGYQDWKDKWTFKKSYDVDCSCWCGAAVFHHVVGIGYDVSAF